jgi:hypothetical protein
MPHSSADAHVATSRTAHSRWKNYQLIANSTTPTTGTPALHPTDGQRAESVWH